MSAIISGFPSKIAALQFEWSLQNTHTTRHISAEDRITARQSVQVFSKRTGRSKKRMKRPRDSLQDKLSNIHLLLRVKSFERWPLKLHFFAEDVFNAWQKMCKKTLGSLRPSLTIVTDFVNPKPVSQALTDIPPTSTQQIGDTTAKVGAKGIHALPVDFAPLKDHVIKSTSLILNTPSPNCGVCHNRIHTDQGIALTCPNTSCNMISHLKCLANHFLAGDSKKNVLLPIQGQCPRCNHELEWTELVREASLRLRGEEVVNKMLNPKSRKGKAVADIPAEDEDDDDDDLVYQECAEDGTVLEAELDNESELDESSDELPLAQVVNRQTRAVPAMMASPGHIKQVIPNSDWDDIENVLLD
jgi:structure-specific endonuclease subunit SLX1